MQPTSVVFDPLQLMPEASLNRTRIADLPGGVGEWVGRPAGELLSLGALERMALQFGFSAPPDGRGIPWRLAQALGACKLPLRSAPAVGPIDLAAGSTPAGRNDLVRASGPTAPVDSTAQSAAAGSADLAAQSAAAGSADLAAQSAAAGSADLAAQSAAALRVADVFGRRLAHLIATLTSGRAVAPPLDEHSAWRATYLAYWAGVDRVWLGGGLASALGDHLLAATLREVARLEHMASLADTATSSATARTASFAPPVRHVVVELAAHADVLALIGAARTRPRSVRPGSQLGEARGGRRLNADGAPAFETTPRPISRLVLDFGHSLAKRATATVSGGRLSHVVILPSLSTALLAGREMVDFIVEGIAETYRAATERGGEIDPDVVVSFASYIAPDGLPAESASRYAALRSVGVDVVNAALRERTGAGLRLNLVHDGTAAARAVARGDGGRAAVIMLGTALGVGFSPDNAGAALDLLELAPDYAVDRWSDTTEP